MKCSPHRLQFGIFEVDLEEGELRKRGRQIKLHGQPFQILVMLLEHQGGVVSRDDLRRELWSDNTFVDFDRSLNKAMNKLRHALGDSAESPRFIETVPRRGYRFIAPVNGQGTASEPEQIAESAGQSESTAPPAPAAMPRHFPRRWRPYLIITTAAACLAALVYLRYAPHSAASTTQPPPSVAVLDFKNLSRRSSQAWLSTALPDWLTTELAAGDRIRTVPEQSVTRMKSELRLPEGASLAKDTLLRIRQHLDADLVVVGSYAMLGAEPDGKIRLDLELQDARNGETLSAISEWGTESNLFDLVSRAGARLRTALGVPPVTNEEASEVQSSQPPNPQVAHLYSEGLAQLKVFDGGTARDLLQQAVEAQPANALTHSALSVAWTMLGYDENAEAEAKRAVDLSSRLERRQRLLIEARYDETLMEWQKAVGLYQALVDFFPDNLEYSLVLVNAQTRAGKGQEALTTVQHLRSLAPPLCDDPRIDLAEARAAESLGDYKRDDTAASRAVRKARKMGAPLLRAQALNDRGWALENLGDLAGAIRAATEAERLFTAGHDPGHVASSVTLKAIALSEQGNLPQSLEMFTRALGVYRRIGNRDRLAVELNNTGVILDDLGNPSEALKRFQEARTIYRTLRHQDGIALTTGNIADVLLTLGDPASAQEMYRESLAVCRQIGDRSKTAMDLAGLARVLRAEGNLEEAQKYETQALTGYQAIGDKHSVAQIRLEEALLLLGQNRPVQAAALANGAADEFRRENVTQAQAFAYAVLSRALLAQGKTAAARDAVLRANEVQNQSRDVRLFLGITAARVRAASDEPGGKAAAAKSLRAILAEAKQQSMVIDEFEARLALGKIELDSGNTPRARLHLEALREDAARRGLGLIAHQAAAMLVPPSG